MTLGRWDADGSPVTETEHAAMVRMVQEKRSRPSPGVGSSGDSPAPDRERESFRERVEAIAFARPTCNHAWADGNRCLDDDAGHRCMNPPGGVLESMLGYHFCPCGAMDPLARLDRAQGDGNLRSGVNGCQGTPEGSQPCDNCADGTHESCLDPKEQRQTRTTGAWTTVHCCCWTEDAARDAEAERRRDANEARWERDAVGMAW